MMSIFGFVTKTIELKNTDSMVVLSVRPLKIVEVEAPEPGCVRKAQSPNRSINRLEADIAAIIGRWPLDMIKQGIRRRLRC